MENQKTLTGKSTNKDVVKSITRSKDNERIKTYYNQLIGNLRGESRPEILPFRENAVEVSGVSKIKTEGLIPESFKPKGNYLPRERVISKDGIMRVVTTSESQMPVIYDTEDSKPEIGQAMRRYGVNDISPPLNNWSPIIKLHRNKEWRESKDSPTLSQTMGTGGNNVPMVMSLYPRSGNPKQGGTGTLCKKDEAFCVDTGNMQGVMNTITQAFGRSGCSYKENKSRENILKTTGQLRRLTPKECERLQGFPDDWTLIKNDKGKPMSDTQRYKMMGNAVTVNVIKAISKKLSD